MKTIRNKDIWKGNHDFIYNLILPKNKKKLIIINFLIILIAVLSSIYSYSLFQLYSIPLIMTIFPVISLLFLYKTIISEPGYINSNEFKLNFREKERISQRTTKIYINKGKKAYIKFCWSCFILKPTPSSHCSICNACVFGFDHHCQFLNLCIGIRNYKSFVCLLSLILVWVCVIFIIFTYSIAYSISHSYNQNHTNNSSYIPYIIISSISLIPLIFLLYYIGKLTIFHFYIILNNISTKGFIKKEKSYKNPMSMRRNVKFFYPNDRVENKTYSELPFHMESQEEEKIDNFKRKNMKSNINTERIKEMNMILDKETYKNMNIIIENHMNLNHSKTTRDSNECLYSILNYSNESEI